MLQVKLQNFHMKLDLGPWRLDLGHFTLHFEPGELDLKQFSSKHTTLPGHYGTQLYRQYCQIAFYLFL